MKNGRRTALREKFPVAVSNGRTATDQWHRFIYCGRQWRWQAGLGYSWSGNDLVGLDPFDNPSGLPPELPVSLGSLDRALPMQFNTLGSTIDTEMALYGPEGKLLRENDNFSETGQSAIAIPPNLEEGTYYIAVGQHNTIFGGGFYTRAPSAAAADFLLIGRTGQESLLQQSRSKARFRQMACSGSALRSPPGYG